MPKLTGPLFSVEAHKALGKVLTYQRRPSGASVYGYKKPKVPLTVGQMYQRWLVEDYVYLWQVQSDAVKAEWEAKARGQGQSGYSYFLSYYLKNLPDIAGMWHLDEKSGSIAKDFSRNANNGTIYGATPVVGIIDYALSFDSINDYINCGNKPSLALSQVLTIETVVYPTVNKTFNSIAIKGAYNVDGWFIMVSAANLQVRIYKAGANYNLQPANPVIPLNTWSHLTIIISNTDLKAYFYRNGISLGTVAMPWPFLCNPVRTLDISQSATNRAWGGLIDHVILRNRILDTTEILRHSKRRYPL